MGARHPNWRLVKTHRSYKTEELSRLFGLHKNTVRAWLKQGLTPIDNRRPALFHGATVAAFLRTRREKAKRPCAPGQLYCLRCRAPKDPAGDMADYVPITETRGNLRGLCPACEGWIHRGVRKADLPAIQGKLVVTITAAPSRIIETAAPTVNCDSKPRGQR